MSTFSLTAFINASPERVFSVISDPKQIPHWRKDVPAISEINGSGITTTFLEDVNFMGRKKLRMKVTEFSPNSKLTIMAQGGMSILPTQSFTFTPKDSGTEIRLDVNLEIKGPMKLVAPLLPVQFKKIWNKYFENLNEYMKK